MSSKTDAHKTTTLRCFAELWDQQKMDVADQIFSAGLVCHAPGDRDMHGRDALKALVRSYHAGFPGLKISVLGQLSEGDRVVTEFTMAGTHSGKWMGVPATGRDMQLGCVAFSRISDGVIAEQWYEWERRKLLEQLALVPILRG